MASGFLGLITQRLSRSSSRSYLILKITVIVESVSSYGGSPTPGHPGSCWHTVAGVAQGGCVVDDGGAPATGVMGEANGLCHHVGYPDRVEEGGA